MTVKSWDEIKNAISNLKKAKKTRTQNLYNLPIGSLLKVDDDYYLVEEKEVYEDWTEYKLKNILNNKKSYLEVEEDRITLWEKADRKEEIDILERFYKGLCSVIESGHTDEYKYYTVKCKNNLYSIEEYSSGSEKEKEVYKAKNVGEVKLL